MDADSGNDLARALGVATRLPAQDLERARRFYSEKLGLDPVDERPGGLLYRCADSEFVVFASTGSSPGSFTQMALRVDDIEAVVAELKRRGVVFEEVDLPGLRTRDGIAEIQGNYPSTGARGERGAWFHDSEETCWASANRSSERSESEQSDEHHSQRAHGEQRPQHGEQEVDRRCVPALDREPAGVFWIVFHRDHGSHAEARSDGTAAEPRRVLARAAVPGGPGRDRVLIPGPFVTPADIVSDDPALCDDACATQHAGTVESVHAEAEEEHADRQRDEREEPFTFHVFCDARDRGAGCECTAVAALLPLRRRDGSRSTRLSSSSLHRARRPARQRCLPAALACAGPVVPPMHLRG